MLTAKPHNCRGLPCRTVTSLPCTVRACHRRARANHALTTKGCFSALQQQSCSACVPALQQKARPTKTITSKAYLNSDGSGSGGSASQRDQLKVVVVGSNPAGLAAALALAQQAGCAVEVHDSRADPRSDKQADSSSTLVGLGEEQQAYGPASLMFWSYVGRVQMQCIAPSINAPDIVTLPCSPFRA